MGMLVLGSRARLIKFAISHGSLKSKQPVARRRGIVGSIHGPINLWFLARDVDDPSQSTAIRSFDRFVDGELKLLKWDICATTRGCSTILFGTRKIDKLSGRH